MTKRTYNFEVEGPLPAQAVLDAMVDFSDKRLQYYPNLQRSTYKVIEQAEYTATVREGAGGFIAQEQYDWSTPGRIRSIVQESNFAAPGGTTEVRIFERPNGGFHMKVTMQRDYVGTRGQVLRTLIAVNGGKRAIRRTYKKMLGNVRSDLFMKQTKRAT